MIGERIRSLRQEKSISQAELAKALSVNRMTVNNYETGKRVPDIEFAMNTADFFDVTVEYLSGRTEFRNKVDLERTVEKVEYLVQSIEFLSKEDGRRLSDAFTAALNVAKIADSSELMLYAITNTFTQFTQILTAYIELKNSVTESVKLLKDNDNSDELIMEVLRQKPHSLYANGMNSSYQLTAVISRFTTALIQEIKKELPGGN